MAGSTPILLKPTPRKPIPKAPKLKRLFYIEDSEELTKCAKTFFSKKLSEIQLLILKEFVECERETTANALVERLKRKTRIPYSTLWYHTLKLKELGIIEFETRKKVKLTEFGKLVAFFL